MSRSCRWTRKQLAGWMLVEVGKLPREVARTSLGRTTCCDAGLRSLRTNLARYDLEYRPACELARGGPRAAMRAHCHPPIAWLEELRRLSRDEHCTKIERKPCADRGSVFDDSRTLCGASGFG
jgi:hypothetical protein